jgi:hypothetical protein
MVLAYRHCRDVDRCGAGLFLCVCSPVITAAAGPVASPSSPRSAAPSRGRWDVLLVLIAKAGFTFNCPQTFFKGRKTAISGTTGEIRAPLAILLIVPRLGIADGIPNDEDPARHYPCLHKSIA